MDKNADIEIIFEFDTDDTALVEDARLLFGTEKVLTGSRMVGGQHVTVFIKASLDLLKTVLGFVSQKGKQARQTKILIGEDRIELEGLTPEDAEKLLSSKGVQDALKRLTS